jgi:phosphate:Na+ symporter
MIATILGGIGLFLLGMVLLTEGLKTAAGDALRGLLARFTGGPFTAVVSGAAVTALVQSSSATVLTTIGFVSAGLLTFRQAVGVIFGASLGTTSTGWIVSLLGLKLDILAVALPLVGVGALLRLLARGRAAAVGLALAGFGLIFVGIDVLQGGMQHLAVRVDPAAFPGATLPGRLLLVGVGVAMTVVMQSSSAAVATTLTALHTGTIGFEQAAALVVGQHVGTTVTAALATIGASVAARRTALAHIGFNVLTGMVAFALIPVLLRFEAALAGWPGAVEPTVLIAGFHSGFILVGVLMLVPFTARFARMIERVVPERGPPLTRHLDPTVLQLPAVAVETARRTVVEIAAVLVGVLQAAVQQPIRARVDVEAIAAADDALDAVRRFLGGVRAGGETTAHHERQLSVLHAVDHMERLVERLRSHTPRQLVDDAAFRELCMRAATDLERVRRWLDQPSEDAPVALVEAISGEAAERRRTDRARSLELAARGELDADVALRRLEAMRWLDSSLYHVWRALHHLATPQPRGEVELAE